MVLTSFCFYWYWTDSRTLSIFFFSTYVFYIFSVFLIMFVIPQFWCWYVLTLIFLYSSSFIYSFFLNCPMIHRNIHTTLIWVGNQCVMSRWISLQIIAGWFNYRFNHLPLGMACTYSNYKVYNKNNSLREKKHFPTISRKGEVIRYADSCLCSKALVEPSMRRNS